MSGQEDPHGDEREEGMSACGCDAPIVKAPSDDDAVEHLWQVRDIQFGLASGALLLAGFLTGLAGWETVRLVLSWVALLVGGSTCVPGALKKPAKGKLGVGLLMRTGAAGGTVLGHRARGPSRR